MTFQAVIFDFGGVFTTSPVQNFAEYERACALPNRFIGGVIKARIHDGAFAKFERAEISREEFDEAFAAETRAEAILNSIVALAESDHTLSGAVMNWEMGDAEYTPTLDEVGRGTRLAVTLVVEVEST